MTFTNRVCVCVCHAQWRECKSGRGGMKRIPARINYEHCSRSEVTVGCRRLRSSTDEGEEEEGVENHVGIRTPECTGGRVSCSGLVPANSQRGRTRRGMRWELRGAKGDQRHTGCMRSRPVWSFTAVTLWQPPPPPRVTAQTLEVCFKFCRRLHGSITRLWQMAHCPFGQ